MDSERIADLLERVQHNQLSISEAMVRLRHLPFEDLGFAKIDHHRALRQGFPEVVMGEGKMPNTSQRSYRSIRRNRKSRSRHPA